MAKTSDLRLGDGTRIPILYEDRAVLAIDKPPGWMLVPSTWNRTNWNLQLALESCVRGGAFWAVQRHLKFVRYVHRLDAETSGVLLLAKSPGALRGLSELFETRRMEKTYLAVVEGVPKWQEWVCSLKIGLDPQEPGRMSVNGPDGKEAETVFQVQEAGQGRALVLARPHTGRTHQIRVHLAAGGHPVVGDAIYGRPGGKPVANGLALRAVALAYVDPVQKRPIFIEASRAEFLRKFGFGPPRPAVQRASGAKTA